MGYNNTANTSISDNNVKLTADKVIQILDQVREEGRKSKRRWIWELMQNAKDVPNLYDRVSVEIELNANELIFSHNGNAFTVDNLTGLVQQVSSKHSNNADKKVTGKFGTGFIATHLLADIITVEGVLEEANEEAKLFSLKLDRSGETSEDLIKPIKAALDDLNNIDGSPNFKPFKNYTEDRKETDNITKFRYPLTKESLKTAEIGLKDLILSLPVSLVFLEDIKQVRIQNNIDNTQHLYKVEKPRVLNEEYNEVRISIFDEVNNALIENKYFVVKSKDDIELLVETKDFVDYELIPVHQDQPFIYRDFPLIGTEKFYFPFILNGKTLYPTERRDSIFLNDTSEKVNHNRKELKKGVEFALEFVDFLITKKAKNVYSICLSSLPNYNFDEESNTREWYIENIQKSYRRELIEKKIVKKDDSSSCTLEEIRFPTSSEHNYPELRDLITDYLGKAKVPVKQEQESWIHFLGPENEMHTWGLDLSYGLLELVVDINKKENVTDFTGISDVFSWLNRLYKAIDDLDEIKLHNQYTLVPNHKGELKKLSTLFVEEVSEEDNAFLPDPFLNVLKSLGEDWYKDLIHREIKGVKKAHQKKSMSDLNTEINAILKKDNFLENENSLSHLINLHLIVTPNSREDSFQRLILDVATILFKKEIELTKNEYASKYNYEIVHRLLIQSINKQIERIGSISNLASELLKTKDEVTIWLDGYLTLLDDKTDYSKFLKEGKIIPNRETNTDGEIINVFCDYVEISNYGVSEQPLNKKLLEILKELNPQKNYFPKLLADGIGIKVSNTINFEMLSREVIYEVERIEREKTFEENRKALLDLINWTETEKKLTNTYASKLSILSGRIFYILTIENSENRDDVMKILRNSENINAIAGIIDNSAFVSQIDRLVKLFPDGIPDQVMNYAKEDARKKKNFNNLLEVGSKVEKLFKKTLEGYEISSKKEEIIHAGGGAYDIRVYNPETKKSFYIELKSCRYENTDPINISVSQAKRAVKELENESFSIVIIERSSDNIMDENYIKWNTKYFKNPGKHLGLIGENYDTIKNSSNTNNTVDLKMDFAEFKGSLDYEWVLKEIGSSGFQELLLDINKTLK